MPPLLQNSCGERGNLQDQNLKVSSEDKEVNEQNLTIKADGRPPTWGDNGGIQSMLVQPTVVLMKPDGKGIILLPLPDRPGPENQKKDANP